MMSKMSESRPVKRQRTLHDDQTNKHSSDYLNDVVPSDLLSVICSHLSHSVKASLLPLLIHDRFNPATHCRDDVININQSSFERISRQPGSFQSFVNICPRVELRLISNAEEARARSDNQSEQVVDSTNIDQHLALAKPMLSALAYAMTDGKMKSFHFTEALPASATVAPRLQQLTQLVQDTNRSHNLTGLLIHVHDSLARSKLSCIDLSGFVRGTSLLTLDVDIQNIVSSHPDFRYDTFHRFLEQLPPSLTFVKLLGP